MHKAINKCVFSDEVIVLCNYAKCNPSFERVNKIYCLQNGSVIAIYLDRNILLSYCLVLLLMIISAPSQIAGEGFKVFQISL